MIEYMDRLTPALCLAHRDRLVVFGDNLIGKGMRGQACIRGMPNAYGIPTKRLPSMSADAFFSDRDDEFEIVNICIDKLLNSGKDIILPVSPIGSGLAKMQVHSPKIYNLILSRLYPSLSPVQTRSAENKSADINKKMKTQDVAQATMEHKEQKKLNALDQKVIAEAGSFSTQVRVVEKRTEAGLPYLQLQKKFWNPQKKASEMNVTNLFQSEQEALGNKVLATAFQKMADFYKLKWAQEVREADEFLKATAEESA